MQNATATQVPTNVRELRALSLQRNELVDQLAQLRVEQSRLIQQRADASAMNSTKEVAEFTDRITEIGARIRRLEQQKLAADDGVTAALAEGGGVVGAPPAISVDVPPPPFIDISPRPDPEARASMIAGGMLGLALLALAFYRWGKRSARRLAGVGAPASQDLKELRNAVDTIAVEVERISENQRFVTALLSEKTPEQMAQLKAQVEPKRLG